MLNAMKSFSPCKCKRKSRSSYCNNSSFDDRFYFRADESVGTSEIVENDRERPRRARSHRHRSKQRE